MQKQSPLLKRARKGYHRPRFFIPRRGRIRLLMLLVAGGVAARLCVDRGEPSTADERPALTDSVGAETSAVKSAETAARKPSSRAGKSIDRKLGLKGTLDREAIKQILGKSPPRLDGMPDTIKLRRRNAVFHYSLMPPLQETGKRLLRRYHPKYGAIAAIEPASGRVLALVAYN
ncbi:MAG: hypothetical protein GF344_13175, partial [Chitinivibrionales bacterium]|nr:hypothetical protein [Chitinivibrionales bacterium]MBD3357685.1 hypothetical protein [Chitinivibrionales bacterium]